MSFFLHNQQQLLQCHPIYFHSSSFLNKQRRSSNNNKNTEGAIALNVSFGVCVLYFLPFRPRKYLRPLFPLFYKAEAIKLPAKNNFKYFILFSPINLTVECKMRHCRLMFHVFKRHFVWPPPRTLKQQQRRYPVKWASGQVSIKPARPPPSSHGYTLSSSGCNLVKALRMTDLLRNQYFIPML